MTTRKAKAKVAAKAKTTAIATARMPRSAAALRRSKGLP
jgi:hypothetical protein